MTDAPLLATVPSVELASVGFWNISNNSDFHPTAADLAAAVAALDCPAVRRPTLKFGHTGTPGEGDPTIGLIDGLRLSEDGQTLVGDFVGVPAWLATADAEGRSVIASAYPDRSGEFQKNYVCQNGHVHPFVMHAVALLGVERPGIGTLQSLYDLYTKAPVTLEEAMAKAVQLAGASIDDVRNAFYSTGPGINYMFWIREMFIDPPELIVQNDGDDSLMRVSYAIDADGGVTFGTAQAVKVEYVNARAAAESPTLMFASRAEARTEASTESTSAAEAEANREGGTMPEMSEVAKRLGIAEDADAATVLAALDEALAERADETTVEQPEPVEMTPELLAASAQKLGVVLVDGKQYEATVLAAKQGADARAQQIAEAAERKVSDAISTGRIRPADKGHYLGLMEIDAAKTGAILDAMPTGLVPIAEAGHGVQTESVIPDDLSWFDTAPTEPTSARKDG